MCTPVQQCFLGPTRVHNPNGISIGSAVFAGLAIVRDRQTDHATPSVTMGRIRTVMRPKNDRSGELSRQIDEILLSRSSCVILFNRRPNWRTNFYTFCFIKRCISMVIACKRDITAISLLSDPEDRQLWAPENRTNIYSRS